MSYSQRHAHRSGPRRAMVALVLLTVTLGLALVSPTGTASAAGAGPDRVRNSDFPTVAQVGRIFGYLRGGSRGFSDSLGPIPVPEPSCLGYATSVTPVRSSRAATYRMRGGQTAYTAGLAQPTVAVYRFRDHRRAAAALRVLRRAVNECRGTTRDPSSGEHAVTYRSTTLPKIGKGRFAFRRIVDRPKTGRDWSLQAWVRQGRHLVNTGLRHDLRSPRKKPLVALTRVALRRAT